MIWIGRVLLLSMEEMYTGVRFKAVRNGPLTVAQSGAPDLQTLLTSIMAVRLFVTALVTYSILHAMHRREAV